MVTIKDVLLYLRYLNYPVLTKQKYSKKTHDFINKNKVLLICESSKNNIIQQLLSTTIGKDLVLKANIEVSKKESDNAQMVRMLNKINGTPHNLGINPFKYIPLLSIVSLNVKKIIKYNNEFYHITINQTDVISGPPTPFPYGGTFQITNTTGAKKTYFTFDSETKFEPKNEDNKPDLARYIKKVRLWNASPTSSTNWYYITRTEPSEYIVLQNYESTETFTHSPYSSSSYYN
jgi:hypothetical protein